MTTPRAPLGDPAGPAATSGDTEGTTAEAPDKRAEAYATLQQELADQLGWFFFNESVGAVAAREGVNGIASWTLPDGSPGLSKQFWLPFQVDSEWVE